MNGLPLKMRKPRKPARLLNNTDAGWYYVDAAAIQIHAENMTWQTCVRLTRRQLEQALKIMDDFQGRD